MYLQYMRTGRLAFADASLSAGGTSIRAVHISELRAALQAAYVVAGRTAPAYTDPTLTAGARAVRSEHVSELRSAVVALEG